MKRTLKRNLIQTYLLVAALLALPAVVQAQFIYTTNNGTITITGYTGHGGDVTIPATINGLPVTGIGGYSFGFTTITSVTIGNGVTNIGDGAFDFCNNLTNVAIGNSVANIGYDAFASCISLTSVTIPDSVTSIGDGAFNYCTNLANAIIGNSVTSIGEYTFDACYSLTNVTVPDSVTSIVDDAFAFCINLANVTIGNSVTNMSNQAFAVCANLTGVYFKGNAPAADWSVFFNDSSIATAYYLPGTTGWADFSAYTGIPAVPWLPLIQTGNASFGVRTNQFGFNISWASGRIVVVEASTNLSDWTPIATKTLTGDTFYFNDLERANHSSRFYQLLDFLTPPPGSGGYTGFDFYLDICRSPNSDFNSKIEAFHMIVTFVISNEIRDPISLSSASEAAYIAFSLDPNNPDLNILEAYIHGMQGP